MPRRTDIESILVIGSGPIVIGQACEFDYSGTQACRVLKAEGFRVILVNSNPATIMTDPEFADATYVEPITPEFVEMVIAKEKPDALLATLGGQTALNTAVALHESGVLERYGVELIGASIEAIQRGENREQFKARRGAMDADRRRWPQSRVATARPRCWPAADDLGYPLVVRPSFTMGGVGLRPRPTTRRPAPDRRRRPGRQPDHRGADRGVGARLEGVRARGHARPRRQRGDRLLDREPRPDGRAHRRLDHRRPGDDADRPGVPADARRAIGVIRAVGVDTGGSTSSSRSTPTTGEMIVIEMNPRVSRSSALASKATGFPIAKIAAKLAVGYTLDEIPNDITRETPASFEPTLDYVVVKVPRFAFEKFPAADSTLATHMKSSARRWPSGAPSARRWARRCAAWRIRGAVRHSLRSRCATGQARPENLLVDAERGPPVARRGHARCAPGGRRGGLRGDQDRPLVRDQLLLIELEIATSCRDAPSSPRRAADGQGGTACPTPRSPRCGT